MAIAHDATTTDFNGVSHSSRTIAHTCSGSDRYIRVVVTARQSAGQIVSTTSPPTYGGVAMSPVDATNQGTNTIRHEVWELVNPPAGANNLVVTWSAAVAAATYIVNSYTGVHPATPRGVAVTASGLTNAPSVSVSSAAGELVIGALGHRENATATIGAGQTPRGSVSSGSGSSFTETNCSDEAGAATVTMSWSLSASVSWGLIAYALKPSTAQAATGTLSAGGSGQATATGRKAASGTGTAAAGGQVVVAGRKAIAWAVDATAATGGTVTGAKGGRGAVAAVGAGSTTVAGGKGATAILTVTASGDVVTVAAKHARAPAAAGVGGVAIIAGLRSAAATLTVAGAGEARFVGRRGGIDRVRSSAGGEVVSSGFKHARAVIAADGAGTVTVAGVVGIPATGTITGSGAGAVAIVGRKTGLGGLTATGGGTLRVPIRTRGGSGGRLAAGRLWLRPDDDAEALAPSSIGHIVRGAPGRIEQ